MTLYSRAFNFGVVVKKKLLCPKVKKKVYDPSMAFEDGQVAIIFSYGPERPH